MAGEWWEKDLAAVDRNFSKGLYDEFSSGSTINGKLGDLFNCSGMVVNSLTLRPFPRLSCTLETV